MADGFSVHGATLGHSVKVVKLLDLRFNKRQDKVMVLDSQNLIVEG